MSTLCDFDAGISQQELLTLYQKGGTDTRARLLWSDESRGNIAYHVPPKQLRALPGIEKLWPAAVMRYTARPRRHLQAALVKWQRHEGWETPVLGVHVRHGDSHVLQKPQLGFGSYLEAMVLSTPTPTAL